MTETDFERYRRLATGIRTDLARLRAVLTGMQLRVVDYVDPVYQAAEALTQASAHGRTRELLRELAKADLLLDGALLLPEIAALSSPLGTLQAMTGQTYLPRDALRAFRRGLQACDLVCRIDIDEVATGTGVLVAPTLVATAAHVVAGVTTVGADGTLVAGPGSRQRVSVTFKDFEEDLSDGSRRRLRGEVANLATEWLAWGSPVAESEADPRTLVMDRVDGICIPEGPWDVAVLRLAEQKSMPSWFALEAELPRKPFQVSVLHHPGVRRGGLPLQVSDGRLESRLGDPPVRLLHSASTKDGSSGAPVFDSDFRLVGFHQAGREVSPLRPGEAPVNRAVPVSPLAQRIGGLFRPLEGRPHPLEVLDHTRAAGLGDGATLATAGHTRVVIGRQFAQEWLWVGGLPGARPADRLLVVTGQPGLGLRFTARIVQAMATRLGGLAAAVDVRNCLNEDADTFAGTLVGAFTTAHRDKSEPGLTTTVRDLRNQTGRTVAAELEVLAGDHGAWLVIEGFQDLGGSVPLEVGEVVRDLVANLANAPHLRLVLVGWAEPLPNGFETSKEILVPPTAHDVAALFFPYDASAAAVGEVVPVVQGLATAYAMRPDAPYEGLAHAYLILAPAMAARMAAPTGSPDWDKDAGEGAGGDDDG